MMKISKDIFNVRHAMLIAVVCGIMNAVPAMADNDGCDNEANDRIAPELALCSVHAYNIGEATNPSGANKQLMKDVVALKTTVITQQMEKQYEYMDAMIRRFKTQLEKAVLTTKLQAAGAGANGNSNSGNGGGYAGTGSAYAGNSGNYNSGASRNDGRVTNIFLNDAQNCASKLDTTDMISCLKENYSIIYEATNGGQTVSAEARKQLAADFVIMSNSGLLNKDKTSPTMNPTKSDGTYDASKCESDRAMSQRSGLQTCLTAHSANLRNATDKYNRDNRQDKK